MFIKHQEAHQNVQTNMYHQKQFRPKDVAKYLKPNSEVDHLLIKHQRAPKHQIDMDKT